VLEIRRRRRRRTSSSREAKRKKRYGSRVEENRRRERETGEERRGAAVAHTCVYIYIYIHICAYVCERQPERPWSSQLDVRSLSSRCYRTPGLAPCGEGTSEDRRASSIARRLGRSSIIIVVVVNVCSGELSLTRCSVVNGAVSLCFAAQRALSLSLSLSLSLASFFPSLSLFLARRSRHSSGVCGACVVRFSYVWCRREI